MTYYEKQRDKAKSIRDELFNDSGNGVFHIIDDKTKKVKRLTLPFVLKNPELNLWHVIRNEAIQYFEKNNIEWHKDANNEPEKGPEGHLLSSNISCINHLFYLQNKGELVKQILGAIDSRIINAEYINGVFVDFEIMEGKKANPLNEKSTERKRGSKSTSIDAIMVGKKNDGKNILVLIEWKYTESSKDYGCKYIEDYHKNYVDILKDENCPIILPGNITGLFFEPYYQLMRQTLLGWKMVELFEYNCDEYIHLHIIPSGNVELRNACKSWKTLLKEPKKYSIISPDAFFYPLFDELKTKELIEYLRKRYW